MQEAISVKRVQSALIAAAMALVLAFGLGAGAQQAYAKGTDSTGTGGGNNGSGQVTPAVPAGPAQASKGVAKNKTASVTNKAKTLTVTYKVTNNGTKAPTAQVYKVKGTKAITWTIPATVTLNKKKYTVTSIADNAFKGSKVTKVTTGKNIKKITAKAFKGATKLKTIVIANAVTRIQDKAFTGLNVTKITVGSGIKNIAKNTFYGAKKLTTLQLGKNLKTIKANAFKTNSKLKTVILTSKKVTKKGVKNSLKGSKVSTIKVKVGTTAQNKTYVKKYKKYFTRANAGKAATVKR